MADQEILSALSKAASYAKSFYDSVSENVAFISATFVTALVAIPISRPFGASIQLTFFLVAVFSGVYWLALLFLARRSKRQIRFYLQRLGVEEKELLRVFFEQDRRSMAVNIMYPPTASLVGKGIITYATSEFPALHAPVVIQPYAFDLLTRHPEWIGSEKTKKGATDYDDDSPWLNKP